MKASVLYRVASGLLVLFAAGHTLGFQQADPAWGVGAVLEAMQSSHFAVQGFTRTYWDFFLGTGFIVGVFYLFAAIVAWQLGGIPKAARASMRVTAELRRLLCRCHGDQLAVSFLDSNRLFCRRYRLPYRRRLVFGSGRRRVGLSD